MDPMRWKDWKLVERVRVFSIIFNLNSIKTLCLAPLNINSTYHGRKPPQLHLDPYSSVSWKKSTLMVPTVLQRKSARITVVLNLMRAKQKQVSTEWRASVHAENGVSELLHPQSPWGVFLGDPEAVNHYCFPWGFRAEPEYPWHRRFSRL